MGGRFEIQVWQREVGRRNGAYHEYDWDTVWLGNSRIRLLLALFPVFAARQGRPLQVIYR